MTAYTTTTMAQIGSFQTGLSASKDKLQGGETAFYAIDVTSTRDGHIDWNPDSLKEVHPTSSTDRYQIQPGDIVFTLLTPPRAVLINDTPLATPAIVVGSTARFRVQSPNAAPGYIAWLFNQPRMESDVTKRAKGIAIQFIKIDDLGSIEIQLPPIAKQRQIEHVWQLQQRVQKLERARLEHTQEQHRGMNHELLNQLTSQSKGH